MAKNRSSRNSEITIEVCSRHDTVPDDLRSYAVDKAAKLVRYHDRISSIQIVADHVNEETAVEMIVHVDSGSTFVAKQRDASPKSALDQLASKMQRQLRKDKEKLKHHKGDGAKGMETLHEPPPEPEESYEDIVRKDLEE